MLLIPLCLAHLMASEGWDRSRIDEADKSRIISSSTLMASSSSFFRYCQIKNARDFTRQKFSPISFPGTVRRTSEEGNLGKFFLALAKYKNLSPHTPSSVFFLFELAFEAT